MVRRTDNESNGQVRNLYLVSSLAGGILCFCTRTVLPADVTNPPDLAVDASNLIVTSSPFDVDGNPTKIGCHAVVFDRGNERHRGQEVVEDPLAGRTEERQADDRESGAAHD